MSRPWLLVRFMNYRLLSRYLGVLALLIGGFMLLSLLWAFPDLGFRTDESLRAERFEYRGFVALVLSTAISWGVGGLLFFFGKGESSGIYRREAMAMVGLGWALATVLGALPYLLSGTCARPAVRENRVDASLYVRASGWSVWKRWDAAPKLAPTEERIIRTLVNTGPIGCSANSLAAFSAVPGATSIIEDIASRPEWKGILLMPGDDAGQTPSDRASHYRLAWVPMGVVDALFESQSGFSTTGATVIVNLNDSWLVPHCILFWRASTHLLGGLGIIVLFVVILGQGSTGKALMRVEMAGPTKEGNMARMQHSAWMFGAIYLILNVALAILLMLLGVSLFDALCHAFATMATGGFSTYNASVTHFQGLPGINSDAIEYLISFFMFLAGANFLLLYLLACGLFKMVWNDIEFRVYGLIVLTLTMIIAFSGMYLQDPGFDNVSDAIRISLFQTASVQSCTGFVTADFDQWNNLSRMMLLLTMFIGGCSGSTAGGLKVIRYVLLVKILRMELEHAYRPRVIRLLRIGGKPIDDQELRRNILVYCAVLISVFLISWIIVVAVEPGSTWDGEEGNKLIDSASAVVTSLSNCGPGLGVCGASQNFSNFCDINKLVFILVMILGRLEIFSVLVLFLPGFWRDS